MYVTLTRRKILCIAMTAILLLLIVCFFLRISASGTDGSTDKARREFAESIGCTVKNASERKIIIPTEFSEAYIKYNSVQRAAGFDLSAYKGCRVKLYTFSEVSYSGIQGEAKLNLIVYKGKIIGGDISSTAAGGKTLPLKKS